MDFVLSPKKKNLARQNHNREGNDEILNKKADNVVKTHQQTKPQTPQYRMDQENKHYT